MTPTALPASFTARLRFRSDWHVGMGAGRPGDVDRMVQRDREGLPIVPAKTVVGVWRDAAEIVASALDGGSGSPAWRSWVDFLFGDQPADPAFVEGDSPPRAAALSVRPARLPSALRAALALRPALQESVTLVKPGVKIDPRSGRAQHRHLRFVEHARAGAELEAQCELDPRLDDEQRAAASALLLAAAALVRRVGGKRRRGAGRCELTVEGAPDVRALLRPFVEGADAPPAPPDLGHRRHRLGAPQPAGQPREGYWTAVLRLELATPVLVPDRTVGNLVRGRPAAPGTMLLPRVLEVLRDAGADIEPMLSDGSLVVTHAVPALRLDGAELAGHPVPQALATPKGAPALDGGGEAVNVLHGADAEVAEAPLKPHPAGYVADAGEGRAAFVRPRLSVSTHNTVEDGPQRPTEAVGGVYTYQALAAGTILRAEVRVRTALAPGWSRALAGELWLGSAKKDDYGHARLEVVEERRSDDAPARAVQSSERLLVWVLSDVLLRDARLRANGSFDALGAALGEALGVTLELENAAAPGGPSAAGRARRTESWHVRWQRPRPTLTGIGPGACAVYRIARGALDPARVGLVEWQGLGGRRAEGFGQVAIDPGFMRAHVVTGVPSEAPSRSPSEAGATAGCDHALAIERAAWRSWIEEAAAAAADDGGWSTVLGLGDNQPTQSQLGGLRAAANRTRAWQPESSPLIVFHRAICARRDERGAEGWPKRALDSLRPLATDERHVWQVLDKALPAPGRTCDLLLDPARAEQLERELWAEAVRALVDACLRALTRHRERAEEPRQAESAQ